MRSKTADRGNTGGQIIGGMIILLFLVSGTAAWAASAELVIGNFSAAPQVSEPARLQVSEPARLQVSEPARLRKDAIPADWQPLLFKKIKIHSRYRHVLLNGRGVIEAQSKNGASGLIRKISVNPGQYPVITWQWQVKNILSKGDVSKKSGDDYPARIYINFAYDAKRVGFWEGVKFTTYKMIYGEYPPIAAINYIWANKAKIGTVVPNPYTSRVKMFVIESGSAKTGEWLTETRNIVDDYRAAFKEEPPPIASIAIMTDTDNTGESATAWYGNISMRQK